MNVYLQRNVPIQPKTGQILQMSDNIWRTRQILAKIRLGRAGVLVLLLHHVRVRGGRGRRVRALPRRGPQQAVGGGWERTSEYGLAVPEFLLNSVAHLKRV